MCSCVYTWVMRLILLLIMHSSKCHSSISHGKFDTYFFLGFMVQSIFWIFLNLSLEYETSVKCTCTHHTHTFCTKVQLTAQTLMFFTNFGSEWLDFFSQKKLSLTQKEWRHSTSKEVQRNVLQILRALCKMSPLDVLSLADVLWGQCSKNSKPEFRDGRSHNDLVVPPLPMLGSLPQEYAPCCLNPILTCPEKNQSFWFHPRVSGDKLILIPLHWELWEGSSWQ